MNENFIQACYVLSRNHDNREFIDFLVSNKGQNAMSNNNLSIHAEFGNIFYQNFNINASFYSFLIAQQDETKAIIPKRISYHYNFEKCVNKYLPSFSIEPAEKLDLFGNKNSKYLFYKFNVEIEALGGEKRINEITAKVTARITAKMKDSTSLKKERGEKGSFWLKK